MIYQNGEWKVIISDLYLLGVNGYDTPLTRTYYAGGNLGSLTCSTSGNIINLKGTFISSSGGPQAALTFSKAYDLTHYNKLEVNVNTVHGTSRTTACYINKSATFVRGGTHTASLGLGSTGKRTLDISNLSGEYYIHFYIECYPSTAGYIVDEVVLKM
jgi:hypothetical protein